MRILWMRTASCSWMTVSRSFIVPPAPASELARERHAGDGVERVEDPLPLEGGGLEGRDPPGPAVEDEFQILHRRDVGQVSFVVLQDVRNLVEGALVLAQVGFEIPQSLDVLAHTLELRVGDEHEAVGSAQDQT